MANKPTLPTLVNTGNIQAQLTTINSGYRQIEDEFEKMLSREDNSLPNHMLDALDMDGHKVINVEDGTEGADAVNKSQLDTKEDYLGAPVADGMVLASTTEGERFWTSDLNVLTPTLNVAPKDAKYLVVSPHPTLTNEYSLIAGNGIAFDEGPNYLEVSTDLSEINFEDIALTGVPTAPTAAVGTNTTQVATTAFVNAEIANDAPTKTGGGASGNWNINILGNAETVDGYHVAVDEAGTNPNTIYFLTTGGTDPSAAIWGDISGSIVDQTDLYNALVTGTYATGNWNINAESVDGYNIQVDGTGTNPNTIYFKTSGGTISVDWDDVSNTPTTLAGYGITDAFTETESDARFLGINATAVNSDKVDGYNIQVDGTGTNPNTIYFKTEGGEITVNWDNVLNTPTTVAGYEITDAVTTSGNQTIGGTKTFSSTITGSITGNADTVDGYNVQVDGTGTNPNTIYFKTEGGTISVDWNDVSNTPTTLAGYGITDAFTETESDARFLGISATAVNSDMVDGYNIQVDGTGTNPNTIYFKTTGGVDPSAAIWGSITGTLAAQTDLQAALDAKVPYTGATGNVNLGEYGLTTGFLQADLTPTNTLQVGRMQWNDADGTMDLRLKGNNVTLQLGQEQVIRVVNKTGADLLEANYQCVRISGAQGQRPKVALAQANNDANSADTIGLVTETITNNQEGFVTNSGMVSNINTTGSLQGETWLDGDVLYLSGTVAGRLTKVKPQAPTHTVIVGFVVYAHANNGKIFVKVDNGYEIDELHNVKINGVAGNNVLRYNSTLNVWENVAQTTLSVGDANTVDGYHVQVDGTGTDPNTIYFKTTGGSVSVEWEDVSNTPTTLSGYGITNAYTKTESDANYPTKSGTGATGTWGINVSGSAGSVPWSGISSKPTTVSGFGITDVFTETESDARFLGISATAVNSDMVDGYNIQVDGTGTNPNTIYFKTEGGGIGVDWEDISNTPTTVAGYGITDAVTTSGNQTIAGIKTFSGASTIVNGNLGVGTASPAYKLDVVGGTIRTTQSSSATYATSVFENTASNGYTQTLFNVGSDGSNGQASISYAPSAFFAIGPTANDTTTPIVFRNNNATERMRIDSSGNLLVGTTTSAYKTTAYVSGQDGFCVQNSATGTGTGNGTLFGLDSSSNGIMWSFDAVNLVFGNTNTERMRIDTAGNVGIGTTSPTQKLDVAGIGRFYSDMGSNYGGGFVLENSASGATNGAKNFRINPTGTLQLINSAYSAVIHEFYNDGSFLASGNISAPAFYDSGNTAYYLDPASNGTRAGFINGNLWINPKSESYGEGVTFYMPNQGTWGGLRWYRNGSAGSFAGNWAFGYFGNESNNDIGFHNGTNGWRLDHSFNMTVNGSVRAPIFYDSNDTAYFTNPNGRSRLASMDYGNGDYYFAGGDWGYRHNTPSGWIQFGPANSFHAHIFTDRPNFYFNAQLSVNGGSNINTSDIRANIFYDNQNTAYYVDPNNYSNLYRVNMGNQKLHNTPLVSYVWDGATLSFPWSKIATLGGTGMLQFELTSKTDSNFIPFEKALVSIGTYDGIPSFSIKMDGLSSYDGMLSVLIDNSNNVWVRSIASWNSFFNYRVLHNDGNTIYEDSIAYQNATPTGIVLTSGQQARGTQGAASSASVGFSTNRVGCLTAQSRVDAPIFYDSNDTGYYVDPNGRSRLGAIDTTGAAYNIFRTWTDLTGYHGLYSSAHNAAHFYPNNGSYGAWKIDGNRNGWNGIEFGSTTNGTVSLMIGLDSATTGFHNNTHSWQFRWLAGTLYCHKGTYGGGTEATVWDSAQGSYTASTDFRAPIFYDSNNTSYYLDATSTTSLRTAGSWRSDSAAWDGEFAGKIQYHSNSWYLQAAGQWIFRNASAVDVAVINNAGDLTINGQLIVNSGDGSSYIYMADTDEGARVIHCNSNRIGFLTQAGGWGSYCSDDGAWVSDMSVWAPIFYDANDTAFYVNPASTSTINEISMFGLLTGRSSSATDVNTANDTGSFSVRGSSTTVASMSFHRTGAYAINMGLGTDNVFRIGGWSASSNAFQMDGSGNLTMLNNVTAYSDARLKTDVVKIENALDKVQQLNGYTYTRTDTGSKQTGVIAQEVMKVLPEVVMGSEDTHYSVAYGNMVGLLIEAIKEQQEQINQLKLALNQLKGE